MVQRKAVHFITGDYRITSSVTGMINNLNLDTLENRRKKSKATTTYKILKGTIEVEKHRLEPKLSHYRTRGHSEQFVIPRSHTKTHQQSFFPSAIRIWNSLTEEAISSQNVDIFKSIVDTIAL